MQDVRGDKSPKKGHPPIGTLPHKNIDTGMGVERVAFLLQGVDNVYETDLVRPVIAKAEELSGRPYGANTEDDVRFRVIADHARSVVMIIGDGVTPGNEGRGYVLRRLLRRIVRSARLLGVTGPCLEQFATVVRDAMSPTYPELASDFERISAVIRAEEETFLATLTAGSRIFEHAVEETKRSGGDDAARGPGVPAARHVRLPDRPDAGDGRGGRAVGGPGAVHHADERAAQPGQGERRRAQGRVRRRLGVPRRAGHARRDRLPRLPVAVLGGPRRRAAARRRHGARRVRGRHGRGAARPDAVLRRGRWPAGRHRHDHRRLVHRARRRRAVPGRRPAGAPRRGDGRDRDARRRRRRRTSTRPGAPRSRAPTRPPTSCTPACAGRWAAPPPRPAR